MAKRRVLTTTINGRQVEFLCEPRQTLLEVLRDTLALTGAKEGCANGNCGACTVLIDGDAVRSCSVPVGTVEGKVTTIDGISDGVTLHAVQKAWIEEQVAQCGYCQAGQIMAAIALLKHNPNPSEADIDREMTNICRCGTYAEIRNGIRKASVLMAKG